ncbi:Caspase-2, partial [Harpegnathos saltator]
LKIDLHKATEFLDDGGNDIISRYPMRSNPRGLVLLITNIDYNLSKEKPRLSAQHDETNLKELFEQMGFKVIAKRDLTGKDIKEAVKEFSRSSDLVKVDSCFVIISSHGTEDEKHHTEIQGVDSGRGDYEKVLCTEILDYFSVDACPQLSGKPKIFVFQLCRYVTTILYSCLIDIISFSDSIQFISCYSYCFSLPRPCVCLEL